MKKIIMIILSSTILMANQETINLNIKGNKKQVIKNNLQKADNFLNPIMNNGYKYDLTKEQTIKYLQEGLKNKRFLIENEIYLKNFNINLENAQKNKSQIKTDNIKLDARITINNGNIILQGDTFSKFPDFKKDINEFINSAGKHNLKKINWAFKY